MGRGGVIFIIFVTFSLAGFFFSRPGLTAPENLQKLKGTETLETSLPFPGHFRIRRVLFINSNCSYCVESVITHLTNREMTGWYYILILSEENEFLLRFVDLFPEEVSVYITSGVDLRRRNRYLKWDENICLYLTGKGRVLYVRRIR